MAKVVGVVALLVDVAVAAHARLVGRRLGVGDRVADRGGGRRALPGRHLGARGRGCGCGGRRGCGGGEASVRRRSIIAAAGGRQDRRQRPHREFSAS